MNPDVFLVCATALLGGSVMALIKLWLKNEALLSELDRKDIIIDQYAADHKLHAEQRALCLSAADGELPELIDRTDPRYTPLYRSVLRQRQLVVEFEMLAVNRGATYDERIEVRRRVSVAVRKVVDKC